jgi:hypothetical protein
MKLNPYKEPQHHSSIGIYPLLVTLLLLCLHFYTGALHWPAQGDVDAQRNFNSAIAMSSITGYLWFSLRVLHQNVASSLISLLVKTNQLGQFSSHRERLAVEFKHHIFNAAFLALLVTFVYCAFENLLSITQEVQVVILTAAAVPFWFFCFLFLFQVTSNTRYIIKQVLPDAQNEIDHLDALVSLIKLGLTNAIFSMGAIALLPIFWFKKDIPTIDVFILSLFTFSLALYLFWPVFKLIQQFKQHKVRVLDSLNSKIATVIAGYNNQTEVQVAYDLEQLENQREAVEGVSTRIINISDQTRLAACLSSIPLSWTLVKLLEWVVASPSY